MRRTPEQYVQDIQQCIKNDIRHTNPQIPWREIIDFRNILVHQYEEVDAQIVWDIIQIDIPILQQGISTLKL